MPAASAPFQLSLSPLSSRGLGRRPLTAETRVRIPVAVLQNPRVVGGFVVFGVVRHSVRHSRGRLCGREEGIETLSCRVLAAGHEVPVAVPGLADIAVAGPGGDLLPVETGGDEVRDRAVPGLVRGDRLEAGLLPRLVRTGSDRGREERLGRGAAEDEVATSRPVRALWAISSLRTTNAIGTARRPAPVLTSTGPLTGSHERSTRITPASKSTLVHCRPRSSPRRRPQKSATAQNARSESGRAARYSWARSGGSILSRRPRTAGRSRLSVGSIEISSRRIARRKMTRSGSRMFAMVEADRPCLRRSSTKS